ncbi:cytochrome c1 heme lyase, putative [Babesia caballi]|uniref:holocytochrome-c synthase n=1 Tax=Babesia caballi TaxID=5871 RepID=A0AAV4LTP5_BABCB|nr:cytochrome c1 heme lyase, putative [Babesia caballi]
MLTWKAGHRVEASAIPAVVKIHNAINEKAWERVMEYEDLHAQQCQKPVLAHFIGKKDELSIRARVRHFTGYKLPYDRHDWTVDRCGKLVSSEYGHKHLLAGGDQGLDLLGYLVEAAVVVARQLKVVLAGAVGVQEGHEAVVVDADQLILRALHVGDLHVVRGRAHVLVLLAGEDVDAGDVGLRVTVLAGLGGRVLDDLAWLALDHHEAVHLDRTGGDRDGVRRTGEGVPDPCEDEGGAALRGVAAGGSDMSMSMRSNMDSVMMLDMLRLQSSGEDSASTASSGSGDRIMYMKGTISTKALLLHVYRLDRWRDGALPAAVFHVVPRLGLPDAPVEGAEAAGSAGAAEVAAAGRARAEAGEGALRLLPGLLAEAVGVTVPGDVDVGETEVGHERGAVVDGLEVGRNNRHALVGQHLAYDIEHGAARTALKHVATKGLHLTPSGGDGAAFQAGVKVEVAHAEAHVATTHLAEAVDQLVVQRAGRTAEAVQKTLKQRLHLGFRYLAHVEPQAARVLLVVVGEDAAQQLAVARGVVDADQQRISGDAALAALAVQNAAGQVLDAAHVVGVVRGQRAGEILQQDQVRLLGRVGSGVGGGRGGGKAHGEAKPLATTGGGVGAASRRVGYSAVARHAETGLPTHSVHEAQEGGPQSVVRLILQHVDDVALEGVVLDNVQADLAAETPHGTDLATAGLAAENANVGHTRLRRATRIVGGGRPARREPRGHRVKMAQRVEGLVAAEGAGGAAGRLGGPREVKVCIGVVNIGEVAGEAGEGAAGAVAGREQEAVERLHLVPAPRNVAPGGGLCHRG